MATEDPLKQNERDNEKTTGRISHVYSGAVLTLIVLIIRDGIPALKEGRVSLQQAITFPILIMISIHSMRFYQNVIVKMHDTKFGHGLSISLPLVFFALVVIAIYQPIFSVIGLGLACICLKSGQLYYLVKSQKINPVSPGTSSVTISYFGRIFSVYLVASIFTLIPGILADFEKIKFFENTPQIEEYKKIKEELNEIQSAGINTKPIVEYIDLLYRKTHETMKENRTFYVGLGTFSLGLLIYGLYKTIVIRKITLEDVFKELRRFYLTDPLQS